MEHKIISDLFCFVQTSYNLRSNNMLQRKKNFLGTESVSSLAPNIWELILYYLNNETFEIAFKQNFSNWTKERCSYRLSKRDIACVGFN